jgi:predicted nuclease with TOPRIM domain
MVVKRRVIQMILGLGLIVLMNGCEDKVKESNNDITVPRATYNQLLDQLETVTKENTELRNNNQELDVNLAKSELIFTKKTENEITMKVVGGAVVIILLLSYLGFLYFKKEIKRKESELDEKKKRIDTLESEKHEMEETQKDYEKAIGKLSKDLEILKLEQKQSSLNSVVNKIDEQQTKRVQMINRIEGI